MSAVDIMSEVTPGANCFVGAGEGAGEWFGLGAGAFVMLVEVGGGAIDGALSAFDRTGGFASEPPAIYGCPAGVMAGSWSELFVPVWVALETLEATGAVRALAFAGCCRK